MNAPPNRPDAWQSSDVQRPDRSAGRGPWIIASAVLAAALVLSLTLVALHHDEGTTGARAAETGSSSVDQDVRARTEAQDRAAQSDLRNALVAAKTMYTDSSSYVGADASMTTGLSTIEPSLCYVFEDIASVADGSSCTPISVYVASGASWSAAQMSSSGTCFWVKDEAMTGTTYGSGSPCTGIAAAQAGSNSW